jgi:hypothetical protein
VSLISRDGSENENVDEIATSSVLPIRKSVKKINKYGSDPSQCIVIGRQRENVGRMAIFNASMKNPVKHQKKELYLDFQMTANIRQKRGGEIKREWRYDVLYVMEKTRINADCYI